MSNIQVRRLKMKKAGSRQLLTGSAVEDDIRARAEAIAHAAGDGFEAEVTIGRQRVLGAVRPVTFAAAEAEAKSRVLTKAIDAGRDV